MSGKYVQNQANRRKSPVNAGLAHQNEKALFVTGFTRSAGLTGLKNHVHPVNHVDPVVEAMIDSPLTV